LLSFPALFLSYKGLGRPGGLSPLAGAALPSVMMFNFKFGLNCVRAFHSNLFAVPFAKRLEWKARPNAKDKCYFYFNIQMPEIN